MPSTVTLRESANSLREKLINVLTITELHGRERTIVLSGASMPERGASWGAEQRIANTWPAGSPEATQQVLGAIETASDWKGVWRRTYLGRNPVMVSVGGSDTRIIQPHIVRDLFFDVLRQGSLLLVSWKTLARHGRLRKVNCPHDREEDIQWEMSFEWMTHGSRFPSRLVTRQSGDRTGTDDIALIDEQVALLDYTEIALNPSRPRPPGVPNLSISDVEAMLDAPNKIVRGFSNNVRLMTGKIARIAGLANKARSVPYEIANTALAAADNIVAQCSQFHDEMSRRPVEANTLDRRVASLIAAARYFGASERVADTLSVAAGNLKTSMAKRVKAEVDATAKDVRAVHLVRQGDTLARISARYYGTPDNANKIAVSNGIAYPIVIDDRNTFGGKSILIIPELR